MCCFCGVTHNEKHRYEEYDVGYNPYQEQHLRQGLLFLWTSSSDCIPGNDLVWGAVTGGDQRVETTCDEKGSHDRELGMGAITNYGFDVRDQEQEKEKEEVELMIEIRGRKRGRRSRCWFVPWHGCLRLAVPQQALPHTVNQLPQGQANPMSPLEWLAK